MIGHDKSVLIEITAIIVLLVLIYKLYKQKQYVLCVIFTVQLFEHLNEIIFCFRQNNTLHLLNVLFDVIFVTYAYYTKCYWIIPFFIFGMSIHLIPVYYNKSIVDIVCIKIPRNSCTCGYLE
jgi:hypothetical protein